MDKFSLQSRTALQTRLGKKAVLYAPDEKDIFSSKWKIVFYKDIN